MAKFKVNVISLSLTKNKIAKFGETVEDNQLNGNAEQLVKDGFILPLGAEKEADKVKDVEVVEAEILKPKKATKK